MVTLTNTPLTSGAGMRGSVVELYSGHASAGTEKSIDLLATRVAERYCIYLMRYNIPLSDWLNLESRIHPTDSIRGTTW